MINNENEKAMSLSREGFFQTSNLPAKRGTPKAAFIDVEKCIKKGCIDPDIDEYLSVDNYCFDCDNCWVCYDKVGDNK